MSTTIYVKQATTTKRHSKAAEETKIIYISRLRPGRQSQRPGPPLPQLPSRDVRTRQHRRKSHCAVSSSEETNTAQPVGSPPEPTTWDVECHESVGSASVSALDGIAAQLDVAVEEYFRQRRGPKPLLVDRVRTAVDRLPEMEVRLVLIAMAVAAFVGITAAYLAT